LKLKPDFLSTPVSWALLIVASVLVGKLVADIGNELGFKGVDRALLDIVLGSAFYARCRLGYHYVQRAERCA
jgi:hypothetical protein